MNQALNRVTELGTPIHERRNSLRRTGIGNGPNRTEINSAGTLQKEGASQQIGQVSQDIERNGKIEEDEIGAEIPNWIHNLRKSMERWSGTSKHRKAFSRLLLRILEFWGVRSFVL